MNRYALTHPSHTKDTLLGVGSLDPIRSFPIPMRDKEGNTAIWSPFCPSIMAPKWQVLWFLLQVINGSWVALHDLRRTASVSRIARKAGQVGVMIGGIWAEDAVGWHHVLFEEMPQDGKVRKGNIGCSVLIMPGWWEVCQVVHQNPVINTGGSLPPALEVDLMMEDWKEVSGFVFEPRLYTLPFCCSLFHINLHITHKFLLQHAGSEQIWAVLTNQLSSATSRAHLSPRRRAPNIPLDGSGSSNLLRRTPTR